MIFLYTFVVLESSNYYCEASITNTKTETVTGRQTGESPAVLTKPCFDGSSGDRPYLFNFKSIKTMLEPMDKCALCEHRPITAELIIKDLLSVAEMAYFSENLHEMFLSFVRDYDSIAPDFKNGIITTYVELREHIKRIEIYQMERSKQ